MVGLLSLEEESDLALLRLFPQPLPPYKATVAVRDSLRLELPSSSICGHLIWEPELNKIKWAEVFSSLN